MFDRQIWLRLDFLKSTDQEKSDINSNKIVISLQLRQRVACRHYVGKQKWRFGRIIKKLGKLHYLIHLDDGRNWKRHINQIRKIREPNDEQENMD